jgi:DNA-3-methyladenine glycosylase I
MADRDVDRLVQDASIIRNRAKIEATVANARAMMSASPSLAALVKSYGDNRKRAPRYLADVPKTTAQPKRSRSS